MIIIFWMQRNGSKTWERIARYMEEVMKMDDSSGQKVPERRNYRNQKWGYNEMQKRIKRGYGKSAGKRGNMKYNKKWGPRRNGKRNLQRDTNKNGPRNPRGLE